MRVRLVLLMLLGAGVGLLVYPPLIDSFPDHFSNRWMRLWRSSVEMLAMPLSLLVIGLVKSEVARFLQMAWGAWIFVLSLVVLFQQPLESPHHTLSGVAFFLSVTVLSVSLILFSFFWPDPKTAKSKS